MERLRGDLPPNVCAAGSSCAYASTSTRRATRPSARVISLPSRSGATSPGIRAKNACDNGDLFESGIAQHLHQALVHAIVVFEGKDLARPLLERGMEGVHVVPQLGMFCSSSERRSSTVCDTGGFLWFGRTMVEAQPARRRHRADG